MQLANKAAAERRASEGANVSTLFLRRAMGADHLAVALDEHRRLEDDRFRDEADFEGGAGLFFPF